MKTRLLFCLVIFALLFSFNNVKAATTYTWNGAATGNWNNQANWVNSAFGTTGHGYPGQILTTDNATISTNNVTISYPSGGNLTINSLTTNATGAIIQFTGGTSTLTISTASLQGNGTNLTFNTSGVGVTGTASITGGMSFGFNAGFVISTRATVNLGGIVDCATNNQATITNSGTLNFLSGSTLNIGFKGALTNNSIVTATNTTFSLSGVGAPGSLISNTNTGVFTVNGGSTITIPTAANKSYISNSGTFYAGTSNSSCTINLNNQPANTTTQPNLYNSGIFYLGSTSSINLGSSVSETIYNAAGGTFTLQSDQYGSASFGSLTLTSPIQSFAGIYNVQRYLAAGTSANRGYRALSSPVNISGNTAGGGNIGFSYLNTTVGGLNGMLTAGPGGAGNGFTLANPNPTVYLYNEISPSSSANFTAGKYAGLTTVTATTVNTLSRGVYTNNVLVPVGNGYLAYFIGSTLSLVTANTRSPDATTMTAIGTLNQNTVAFNLWSGGATLSYADPVTEAAKGVNLLGNPYPSTINLHTLWTDNLSPAAWTTFSVIDNTASVNFLTYNAFNGMMSNSTRFTGLVGSGQGFYVQTTATGQTVNFKEDIKVSTILSSTSTPPSILSARQNVLASASSATDMQVLAALPTPANVLTGLHLQLLQDTLTNDEVGIYFSSNGSDKFEKNDAYDMDGLSPKIYLSSYTSDGVRTSINALGDYIKGKTVKLYVKATTDGLYHLKMTDIFNIDTTAYDVYLRDKYLKDSLDIRRYPVYNFNIQNSDTASFGANRFELSIKQRPVQNYQLISFAAQNAGKGIQLTWNTLYEGDYTGFGIERLTSSGQYVSLYTVQGNGTGTYIYTDSKPLNGVNTYRLMQNDINGNVTYAAITIIDGTSTSLPNGAVTVYPNPASNMVSITLTPPMPSNATSYQMKMYSSAGILVIQQASANGDWSQNVAPLKPGVYTIMITDNNGNTVGSAKLIKP